jgi:RsiW-degrading membrane proteinase PrsW (M82 family)
MTLAPLILFTLEIFIGLIILSGVVVYVVAQPELAQELQRLSQEIMILGPESEAAGELLAPFLTQPGVMAIALIYIAILVPAIEEIFKPIGVWLFARDLYPAQGLTLGALSGAGYALIETIGVSAQTSEWASLLFSRIGTGLLHITTSALMGGAIVLAWRERRYLRLIGTYLLAVSLHGLWNAFAVFFTFSTLAELFAQPGPLGTMQSPIVIAMVALSIVLFAILILSNLSMRKMVSASAAEPDTAGEGREVRESTGT